jgi:hypothetical protein
MDTSARIHARVDRLVLLSNTHRMIRISATIPDAIVRATDAHAERADRSRSWVISEALRRYLASPPAPKPESDVGLGASRLAQLRADLELTPEERVKEADRTLSEYALAHPSAGKPLIAFDSFEEYFEWDRRERLR